MKELLGVEGKILDLTRKTYVMGILNVTPDSFSDGGKHNDLEEAVEKAKEMVEDGAEIIDIGGESSRPGADYVDIETELSRVIPIIERISKEVDVLISIDTYKAIVAKQAIKAGAHIINDITGFKGDVDMAKTAKELDVPCILMHMRGTPKTMQNSPLYSDVVREIKSELQESIDIAFAEGINKDKIILDPGIGFAKRFEDNLVVLKNLKELKKMGYPILMGASRKRFIGEILEVEADDRLEGSLAVAVISSWEGARILRVHDVKETVRVLKVTDAIRNS